MFSCFQAQYLTGGHNIHHSSHLFICKICVHSLCLAFQFAVSEYGLDRVSFSQHIESEWVQRPARKLGVKCEGCLCVWGSWQDFRSVEMEIRRRRQMCWPSSCRKDVCRDWHNFIIATSIYYPSLFTQIYFVTLSPPFAWTDSLKQSNPSGSWRWSWLTNWLAVLLQPWLWKEHVGAGTDRVWGTAKGQVYQDNIVEYDRSSM